MPKISVIMGIYNCAETLPQAIDSILNQTYTDWNMIMCDDGSADNTVEVAEKYVTQYPDKFVLIKNEKNMGLNFTLNKCLEVADGEYIARMDGDDISVKDRFEKEVDFLDNHPEYAIVSTPIIYFDESGEWAKGKAVATPEKKDFIRGVPHCHAPCMIRREAYLAVGGYTVDKRLLRVEDMNLWFKLYSAGYKGYNLDEPLYKMRDDRNAYKRRTFSSRMRIVYAQYTGFKMIKMPLKYYPVLLITFAKGVVSCIIPSGVYSWLHKKNFG